MADHPLSLPSRRRLWTKLAVFGALGVVVTHSVHLLVASRISTHTLGEQLARDGQALARLLARQVANTVLADDLVSLQEAVDTVSSSENVSYCFVTRAGTILASSFRSGTPTALVTLRGAAQPLRGGAPTSTRGSPPLVVASAGQRQLDIAEEIGHASSATVRVGLRLTGLVPLRHQLAVSLGAIAVAVILVGLFAAFVVGRGVARPLGEMVTALQHIDPATPPHPLRVRREDEIGLLTRHVNEMRERLHAAHLAQLEARRRELQTEKLAALGKLVAGVAHEVNNPLAGIKNCHRRLSKPGLPEERRVEYLGLMEEGLLRIERVVGQLLDFARVRAPRRTRETVERLLSTTRDLLRPVLETEGIALRLSLAEAGDVALNVDAGQLEQALLNLLLNALYVSDEGGVVEVGARVVDNRLAISITDRGPGIPPEIRSQIENPFFTTKPEGEGTGLGLSVTRTIVDAHGGDLTFRFPDAGGTVATLWLPLDGDDRRGRAG